MYVHLPHAQKHGNTQAWIDTYKLTTDSRGDVEPKRVKTTYVELDANYGGWVEINVTHVVREWIHHRGTNFGLELDVKAGGDRRIEIHDPSDPLESNNNVSSAKSRRFFVQILKIDFSLPEFVHRFGNQRLQHRKNSPIHAKSLQQ